MPARARAREVPLRLACDRDVAASGLATAWIRGFGRDTGLPVRLLPLAADAALDRAIAGDADAVLSASPALEATGLAQGLLHDRRALAVLRWVIVGPLPPGADAGARRTPAARTPPPAAVATDAVAAVQAAVAASGGAPPTWLVGPAGGAGERLLDALLDAAGLARDAVHRAPAADDDPLGDARRRGLYRLAGGWEWPPAGLPGGPSPPWGLLVDHDPRLRAPVHLLRPLRAAHPAARLLADWLAGPRGRRVLAGRRGVRPPDG